MGHRAGGQHVLGEHPGDGHGEPRRGGQERGEGTARDQGAEQVAAHSPDHPVRQQQDRGVGLPGQGQLGGVEAAEGAVERRQQVEGSDQAEDGDGGAAGGDAGRAGVEADHDVRQPHGAQERGQDQAVRGVQRAFRAALGPGGRQGVVGAASGGRDGGVRGEREAGAGVDAVGAGGQGETGAVVGAAVHGAVDGDRQRLVELEGEGGVDADRALLAEGGGFLEGAAGGSVALPGQHQEEGGDEQGGEFEPELEGLDEGDAAHAPGGHDRGDDDGDDHPAQPAGRPAEHGQRQSGALELRQQVQPADPDDEGSREPPHPLGGEPCLGEVGQRVGARAAQRGGDEEEQDEVAGGVADRVPEHVGPLDEDQSGDAEEGGGGEVLAADGGGVQAGSDGAGGDVEVGGGAGDAQAEGADEDGGHDDEGDGGHGVAGVHGLFPASFPSGGVIGPRRGGRSRVRCVRRGARTSGRAGPAGRTGRSRGRPTPGGGRRAAPRTAAGAGRRAGPARRGR